MWAAARRDPERDTSDGRTVPAVAGRTAAIRNVLEQYGTVTVKSDGKAWEIYATVSEENLWFIEVPGTPRDTDTYDAVFGRAWTAMNVGFVPFIDFVRGDW